MENKVILPDLSYKIYGLCFRVHNELGRFRSEKSYSDALEELLKSENIKYKRETPLPVAFKGEAQRRNIPDFIIEDLVVVDVKAKRFTTKEDYYQMKRYLNVSNKKLGLIVNFRQPTLYPKRIVN